MRSTSAVVAILTVAAIAIVSAAIVREDAIEWSVAETQIAFWSKRSAAGTPGICAPVP